jgi:hypothetical protein
LYSEFLLLKLRTDTAKNSYERTPSDRDDIKHLQYFNNGQWRPFKNKECGGSAKTLHAQTNGNNTCASSILLGLDS